MMSAFVHGFILALGLILPLGVQNVFILTQGAVQRRWVHALPAVLTASLCDTLLILLAVLGVSFVWLGSSWTKMVVMGAGVLFLLYMGWSTWKSEPATGESEAAEMFPPRKQIAFRRLSIAAEPSCHFGYDRCHRHELAPLYGIGESVVCCGVHSCLVGLVCWAFPRWKDAWSLRWQREGIANHEPGFRAHHLGSGWIYAHGPVSRSAALRRPKGWRA